MSKFPILGVVMLGTALLAVSARAAPERECGLTLDAAMILLSPDYDVDDDPEVPCDVDE